jgi:hypothetical protein
MRINVTAMARVRASLRNNDGVSYALLHKEGKGFLFSNIIPLSVEEEKILCDDKCKVFWRIFGAVSIGILVSIGIYSALTYVDSSEHRDPRSRKVDELIEEAENLLVLGKKGTYVPRHHRG